jgi:hypothetical protein
MVKIKTAAKTILYPASGWLSTEAIRDKGNLAADEDRGTDGVDTHPGLHHRDLEQESLSTENPILSA